MANPQSPGPTMLTYDRDTIATPAGRRSHPPPMGMVAAIGLLLAGMGLDRRSHLAERDPIDG